MIWIFFWKGIDARDRGVLLGRAMIHAPPQSAVLDASMCVARGQRDIDNCWCFQQSSVVRCSAVQCFAFCHSQTS